MTITISLGRDTEKKLLQAAAETGQTVESYVGQLVEREVQSGGQRASTPPSPPAARASGTTLEDILAPVHDEFERSGMTEEGLTQFLTETRDEGRREKRARKLS